jgi:MFS family permease
MRTYRELLAIPEVRRMVPVLLLTRLPAPMLGLCLLLAVVDKAGSYADGGLVLTGYAAALAVILPINGRLVDRYAPRRVLRILLLCNVAAYAVTITALYAQAPYGALVLCAVALGGTTPPAGAVTRGLWPSLVPPERLSTAYAFDAVLNETLFVGGPLLVSALVAVVEPSLVVVLVGASAATGLLLLTSMPTLRDKQGSGTTTKRHYLGPLGHPQVLVLLGIIVCDTFAFGTLIVGAPAAAADMGAPALAGVLLSVGSLGAVISGVVYGSRERTGAPGPQLAVLHLASAVLLAVAGQVTLLVVFALLIFVAGLVGGPRDTLHQLVLGNAAPEQYRTEAFAWLSTLMWVGYAGGTAATGQLVQRHGGDFTVAFLGAACAAALAAALSLLVRTPAPARSEPASAVPADPEPSASVSAENEAD